MPDLLCQQEVEMMDKKYLIYLKEVPTKLGAGSIVKATTMRAFIRKIK
ncbi:hypothetical protein HYU21_02025 [Candidatus Woesearchaeota archaeon]|nr:hypothetical protein [Candidatus Woesearchaeota archaeon]